MIMIVKESLYEFAKRGRPRKNARKPIKSARKGGGIDASDKWDAPEDDEEAIDPDEMDVDTSDMEGAETIEIEEEAFDNELRKALINELKVLEPSRRTLKFRLKGDLGKVLYAIPMAKLGESTFIFKLKDGSLKKIKLSDVVTESENPSNRAKMVSEDLGWRDAI